MPDHWGYVIAAYGLAAVALIAYWRRLVRRDRDLIALSRRPQAAPSRPAVTATPTTKPTNTPANNQSDLEQRSHPAPVLGHPRSKPGSPSPLQ
jgi:hypothetical protein